MKKIRWVLSVVLLIHFGGCREASLRKTVEQAPSLTRTVTDDLGRTLTVPVKPGRVISLAPNLTEWVFALNGSGQLIARSEACNFPEAAAEKTAVPTWPRIDFEQISALNPDLILATDEIFSRDDLAALEQLGVPVFIQTYPDMDALLGSAEELGTLLNQAERGKAVGDSLRALNQRIVAETENQIHYNTLLLVSDDPLKAVGGAGLLHALIGLAGGKNVMEARKEAFTSTTVEEILYAQPDYLILPSSDPRAYARVLATYPMLANTPADATRRVFITDPDLFYRPGPRTLQALLELTSILHTALTPDRFLDAP
jgi:iron complex transport system substrate-binding protein